MVVTRGPECVLYFSLHESLHVCVYRFSSHSSLLLLVAIFKQAIFNINRTGAKVKEEL